jgi:2-amino-4-hydroxy-6-hydroxymethyldihydropteridine diphosphokinase
MNKAYLLIGSNIGDRMENIQKATELLNNYAGEITCFSQIYETEPWGFEDSIFFLNQVVSVETELEPLELMECLEIIEKKLGRIRKPGTICSRTIDIDILFYNSEIINEKNLIIPHPKIHLRQFTLIPLMDIAPDFIHPLLKKDISTLAAECVDSCLVKQCIIKTEQ